MNQQAPRDSDMADHQLLIRFDDVCPTMNWTVWDEVEAALLDLDIRPILAVVPDNQDPKLRVAPPRDDFWSRVRSWKARGWTVGIHGYQHVYTTRLAGLVGINPQSEFAGVPFEHQAEMLGKGMAILRAQDIVPDLWIAPAHSFDRNTLTALHGQGIRTLSDGLHHWPARDRNGMLWIPQQLWDFWEARPGVWTVCKHVNRWTRQDLDQFKEDLRRNQPRITDVPSVLARFGDRPFTLGDHLTAWHSRVWLHGLRPRITARIKAALRSIRERHP